jgi:hypothetical protein
MLDGRGLGERLVNNMIFCGEWLMKRVRTRLSEVSEAKFKLSDWCLNLCSR